MVNTVSLTYTGDLHCEAPTPGGQGILPIDPRSRQGQPGAGHSPLDLLALAHGACTAMMVAKAAEGEGLDVRGTQIEVAQEYAPGTPMRLLRVHLRFRLPQALGPDAVNRLRAAAALCPVHTSLRSDIEVRMEFLPSW